MEQDATVFCVSNGTTSVVISVAVDIEGLSGQNPEKGSDR
jgi:hypothetical protein